ncbi:hypothetical protein BTC60_09575 [Salmonella enterica subsp. enterica serovar Derby]|uniref:Uncharacterized protein n=1 Tax=Salmonella enterica TaxID=28901 RepID=A0A639AA89_SALER|nr:hypothetical protein [Salmonella enterica subsp. enterica serovar Derby]EDI7819879.1 hypothetical protein [Salmonella enterica]EDJ3309962.1 hypothetical protein [Salmonella enterica subsp. enterica serovar Idikan]EDH5158843.1 hypothetical protein [Salmonella enterica subsp. enterica serovar Derby]EDH5222055.1 hypothetical protein [Salmonella enterica subsp. enterica serovar Derby]
MASVLVLLISPFAIWTILRCSVSLPTETVLSSAAVDSVPRATELTPVTLDRLPIAILFSLPE